MKFKLVSFNLCPFVQQVSIALSLKHLDFETEFVDLANPPAWFLEASPLKKVPILIADSGQVLFESIAIIEFIEDFAEQKSYPTDLFERSRERAWIQFINQMMWSLFDLSVKGSKEEYGSVVDALHKKLDELEAATNGGKFLFGNTFSLTEAAIAPFLLRLNYIDEIAPGLLEKARHPNLCAVSTELMADLRVQNSTHKDLKELYFKQLGKRKGYLSTLLSEEYKTSNEKALIY